MFFASLKNNNFIKTQFKYGCFGYGYGHQIDQDAISQKQILRESIFPRVDPTDCRRDEDNVCSIMHVDYPDYLPFYEKSEIGK